MQKKSCLYCEQEIRGRSDKKFCDDFCRNSYNNSRNKCSDTMRMINSILKRNRKILEQLIPQRGNIKVNAHKLSASGYNFMYHTHKYVMSNGHSCMFCYEFGLTELDDNFYLLTRED